eukprot:CAMPEP_0185567568 /NCGR_PEP_ID=MMETSP0434-20130131/800_1 /TAXON_ID=626734 ORGANISM="Favella taraikaensis, Strain Fe Narragansett Bay" /NCGR_SAMPLE_ID=MMETSP0434 /ASSEMBLY_ACC=CAM_ASM_000379 /LENGTH=131 /DNA_ID=CAMNT_0028181827 /DNA_START=241 /DNA_END=636 /DNA_ORIENTATION=-
MWFSRVEDVEKSAFVKDAHSTDAAIWFSIDLHPAAFAIKKFNRMLHGVLLTKVGLREGVVGAGVGLDHLRALLKCHDFVLLLAVPTRLRQAPLLQSQATALLIRAVLGGVGRIDRLVHAQGRIAVYVALRI